MKDVNSALRKKYFDLLNGNLIVDGNPVPVYSYYIPNVVNTPYYVIIRNVSNNDDSNFNKNKTNTSIQFGIYTKDTTANPGDVVNEIAAQIYTIVYPTPQSSIDLTPEFHAFVLKLENDITPDALQTDNSIFINRFITFSHKITH